MGLRAGLDRTVLPDGCFRVACVAVCRLASRARVIRLVWFAIGAQCVLVGDILRNAEPRCRIRRDSFPVAGDCGDGRRVLGKILRCRIFADAVSHMDRIRRSLEFRHLENERMTRLANRPICQSYVREPCKSLGKNDTLSNRWRAGW